MFKEYSTDTAEENTWNIKGYTAMIDQARSLIDSAEQSILCSLWSREYDALREQLKGASKRGIETVCFSFTEIKDPGCVLFSYGINEETLRKIWHRQIVLVVDKKHILLGSAEHTTENRSIWTDNPAIRNIALNYIILDMTLYSQRQKKNIEPYSTLFMPEESKGLEALIG